MRSLKTAKLKQLCKKQQFVELQTVYFVSCAPNYILKLQVVLNWNPLASVVKACATSKVIFICIRYLSLFQPFFKLLVVCTL